MKDRIWLTLVSMDGERKLKQHCFKPKEIKGKIRNKSLCGNLSVINDDCKPAIFDEIYSEHGGSELIDKDNVCLRCFVTYNKKPIQ